MGEWQTAINIFRGGGIVIFPTDTIFGIGCRVGDLEAIRKLYNIRKRGKKKPTLILAESLEQVQRYAHLTREAKILAERFWPGPLTLILKATENTPDLILSRDKSIGIRIPNLSPLRKIINQVGEPILAPSANFSGKVPPKRFSEIDKNLAKLVDYVLKFDCGSGEPSTIIKMIDNKRLLLREGAIKKSQLFHKKGV